MRFRFSLIAIVLLSWLPCGSTLDAHTTTIATTGDGAVGIPTATWNVLSAMTLNNAGDVSFTATLQQDGSITAVNDAGVWLFDSSGLKLLTQTGSGNVPGLANADFDTLDSAALSDSGEVAVSGTLVAGANGITTSNNRGIWRYGSVSNSLQARTGSGNVAGVPSANFLGFPSVGSSAIALAGDGQFAVVGSLALGTGGVLSSNDRGLWSYTSTSSTLVAREGSPNVPDVPSANFKNFNLPAINSNNQLAVLSSLQTGGGVTGSNALGIWRYTGTNGVLLARTGVGNVPGAAGANFIGFDSPRMNDLGEVAFSSQLSTGEKGVWLDTGTTSSLLALSGSGNVPDVPNTDFAGFAVTSINDLGQMLVTADLETGVGGVTIDNDSGLWLLGSDRLIARAGTGNVPGLPNADFADFQTSALNENGQVAFVADLQNGVGGVDSTNDSGIWIVDPLGDSRLVAREGEQLAGRTIASLNFAGDGAGQSGGFNDVGELAYQATFTDGDSGLFLFRPYAADFDHDADVDAGDLNEWETAFGATSAADADNDDDSDGADFLVWQREFGSGVVSMPISNVVPEPASGLLLILGLLGVGPLAPCRRK